MSNAFHEHDLQTEATGYIINPWGQSFLLTKELIQMIIDADGDVEYFVSDEPITEELLEDGSFLKKAIEICNRNRTQLNLIKLARILRDSYVWVPCNMIMSDEDYETWSKAVLDAADKGDGSYHIIRSYLNAVLFGCGVEIP